MRLNLVAVGRHPPGWISAGFDTYTKRISAPWSFSLHEITPAKRGPTGHISRWQHIEEAAILKALPPNSFSIVLDVKGQTLNTEAFAKRLIQFETMTSQVNFIIGGPDGLSPECIAQAALVLSLSQLTLPHFLVRILIAEQLYRAYSLRQNHPYHRSN